MGEDLIISSLAPSSSTTVVMLTHIVIANQQAKSHNWVALYQTLPQCIVSYVFKKSIQWIIQIYANLFNAGIDQNNSKLEIVYNCYSLCNYQNKWNILLKGYYIVSFIYYLQVWLFQESFWGHCLVYVFDCCYNHTSFLPPSFFQFEHSFIKPRINKEG